jgi:DNA-binding protein HU-beta
MTKQELVNRVAGGAQVSSEATEKVINETMFEIKKALAQGRNIYLRGFGTWLPKERKAKVARNISRGTSVHVPAHRVPFFKPSKEFKDLLK